MEYKDVPWDNSAANPESYINCWGVTDSYDSTPLILDFGKDFITAEDFEKKLLSIEPLPLIEAGDS